jgi:hypothetical protein
VMKILELEDYLENVLQIIFDVQVCMYNAELIGSESSKDEDWVKEHMFFKHYFHQLRFITVIQLCKLFSVKETQKHNFEKLLKQLESSRIPSISSEKYESSSSAIYWIDNREKLNQIILKIRTLMVQHKETINNLTLLRDTIYAHRDRKAEGEFIPWPKLKELSDLALLIYNELNLGFFGSAFIFPNKENWSPSWVIKQAAKTRSSRKL